jgi:hypothetical protein
MRNEKKVTELSENHSLAHKIHSILHTACVDNPQAFHAFATLHSTYNFTVHLSAHIIKLRATMHIFVKLVSENI